MNGYLQRLATSTRQTISAIHPVVGSFYSSRRTVQTLKSGLGAEQLTSENERRNVSSRTQTTEPERLDLPVLERNRDISPIEQESPQLLMPSPADVRPSIRQNEATDVAPPHQPLQSDSFTSPNQPHPKEPAHSPFPSTRSTTSTFSQPPPQGNRTLGSVIEQLMESAPRTEIAPLIPVERTAAEGDQPTEVRPVRFAADIGRRQKTEEFHQRPPQREPDEIQIHIGRIEVTAVQAPSVVSPSPRQRDPAPSLEEYLQRRGRNNQ